jgi:hypothetical protein
MQRRIFGSSRAHHTKANYSTNLEACTMTKSTSFFFLLAFPFLGIAETLAILTDGHDQVLGSRLQLAELSPSGAGHFDGPL